MQSEPTERAPSPDRAWYASPLVVLVVVPLLVAGGLAVWLLRPQPQEGQGAGDPPRSFRYLALGDSLAAGYQPETGDDKSGGYVGAVLAGLRSANPGHEITAVNLGCSGETTQTLVHGGLCTYPHGSQLEQALAQLRLKDAPPVEVITVDIGANDVIACISPSGVDGGCAADRVAEVSATLADVLSQLRTAAPQAKIVVLDYYNPFLAAWLLGSRGEQVAKQSTTSLQSLNSAITAVAAAHGAELAEVSGAFSTNDFTASGGATPTNVQQICELTWMCSRADIHANDAGYKVLADAVLVKLKAP
ncbi:MAG TPA: SGNH/GDSL hydrolase family protein [Actinomycetales bacterium]|nr:SGNH/GDSL hydrolase family protein [Actinomycetales bacterium]